MFASLYLDSCSWEGGIVPIFETVVSKMPAFTSSQSSGKRQACNSEVSRKCCLQGNDSLPKTYIQEFSSVQSLSHVWLFLSPWTAAHQACLFTTNSQSLLKLMSIDSVMPSNHLILCHPFSSCLQFIPASGAFPVSQLFTSSGQSIGVSASASVLPMNTQD